MSSLIKTDKISYILQCYIKVYHRWLFSDKKSQALDFLLSFVIWLVFCQKSLLSLCWFIPLADPCWTHITEPWEFVAWAAVWVVVVVVVVIVVVVAVVVGVADEEEDDFGASDPKFNTNPSGTELL